MFENLQERLERSFKILKGEGKITEINVAETLKDVRRALLDADVSYKVAKEFCDSVKEKAMGQNVLTAVKPQQMMVKIVHDELAAFMGGASTDINVKGNPGVVLVAGLNGSGKTTFSGKLALNIKSKRGMQVLLAACDTFRPAAIDQLKVLGEQIGVPVYTEEGEKDPVKIARAAIAKAKSEGIPVVIVDTAGRLAVDQELMDEISALHQAVQPTETLFVVDAMTGQDAVETAKAFNDRLDFDGVVLTKMDGDTRGGAALSIKYVTGKPIKYISTGEKMEALDVFHPERIADRILGMGDVVSLVEKAQEQFDEKEARELKKKLAKDKFGLWDFYNQIQQVKKMGNIKDLASMIPGVGKAIKDVDIPDDAFKGIEAIILSMTPAERDNPDILNGSRRKRIADCSGTSLQEVNRLLKQFEGTRKAMKSVMTGNLMDKMRGMRRRLSFCRLVCLELSQEGDGFAIAAIHLDRGGSVVVQADVVLVGILAVRRNDLDVKDTRFDFLPVVGSDLRLEIQGIATSVRDVGSASEIRQGRFQVIVTHLDEIRVGKRLARGAKGNHLGDNDLERSRRDLFTHALGDGSLLGGTLFAGLFRGSATSQQQGGCTEEKKMCFHVD